MDYGMNRFDLACDEIRCDMLTAGFKHPDFKKYLVSNVEKGIVDRFGCECRERKTFGDCLRDGNPGQASSKVGRLFGDIFEYQLLKTLEKFDLNPKYTNDDGSDYIIMGMKFELKSSRGKDGTLQGNTGSEKKGGYILIRYKLDEEKRLSHFEHGNYNFNQGIVKEIFLAVVPKIEDKHWKSSGGERNHRTKLEIGVGNYELIEKIKKGICHGGLKYNKKYVAFLTEIV